MAEGGSRLLARGLGLGAALPGPEFLFEQLHFVGVGALPSEAVNRLLALKNGWDRTFTFHFVRGKAGVTPAASSRSYACARRTDIHLRASERVTLRVWHGYISH